MSTNTKMKDEKKIICNTWLNWYACGIFSHFRQVISKFSEIIADNSQRFLVIYNKVNLNVFFQHTVKVPVCDH